MKLKIRPPKKVSITLKDLLAITVQWENVSLVRASRSLAKAIEAADPKHEICYIEWATPYHPILWPITDWIAYQKRQSSLSGKQRKKEKQLRLFGGS